MADDKMEPGELTQRFRAFAESVDPAPSRTLPIALIATAAALSLTLVVAIVLLVVLT